MGGLIVRRLAIAIPTLLVAATVAFLLAHLAPGGPAVALGGEHGAPGQIEEIARRYGLDRPLIEIYLDWLGRLLTGDLGRSYRADAPVAALIAERLPVTIALILPAILLSAGAGLLLGLAAAPARGRIGRGFVAAMAALHALPGYLVAQLLVLAFARWLDLLPVQGIADARGTGDGIWVQAMDGARHLVLPVLALALHHLTLVALLTRARVAAELDRPYVTTARGKGLAERHVRWRHALPNAMLPLIALMGSRVGSIVVGAAVIETAFALPGLGRLAVTAAIARDHPTVIGIVLVAAAAIVIANLLVDLVQLGLDPRLSEAR